MRSLLALWVLLCLGFGASAEAAGPLKRQVESVEKGNALYGEQHYEKALEQYERAEQKLEAEPRLQFDRGNALFKLGRAKEAREAYLRALGTEDPALKKRNYYNIGNTFFSEQAYQDAMVYYRRALEIDPAFDDARYNLELALRALEQQQQQQPDDSSHGQQQQQQDKQKEEKKDQSDQQKDERDDGDSKQGEGDEDKQDQQQPQEQQDQEKDKNNPDDRSQEQKDQQEQEKDQQQKDQQQDQQGKQGEEKKEQDQKEKKGDQQDEQNQQNQQNQQQSDSEQQKQPDPQQADQRQPIRSAADQEKAGQLSQQQVQDLLDALRDNEKPFQMHKFLLPEFKRRDHDGQVTKDW